MQVLMLSLHVYVADSLQTHSEVGSFNGFEAFHLKM